MVDLDRLIDEALPAYAGEPPAELPDRVMACVMGRVRGRYWRVGAWMAVAGVAAAWVLMWRVPARPVLAPPAPVLASIASPVLTPTPIVRNTAVRARAVAWKPAVLTPEEKRLSAFVAAHPALAEQVFVESPKRMSEAIAIPPLVIEPLESQIGENPQ